MMNKEAVIPFVGKRYEVINGKYKGFIGECVSYDLEHDLPVILQDSNYNGRAVRLNEIKSTGEGEGDISRDQKQ